VPLDEIEVLHKVNRLDAHAVEKWDRIATVDVKESRNKAADINANLDNAFHPGYHPQTFDSSLQKFKLHLDKIKLALVPGKLL
jgi:hypothetical protein